MMRRCIVLAAAFVAAFTIPAETVKTASQPWVTNHVAQATALADATLLTDWRFEPAGDYTLTYHEGSGWGLARADQNGNYWYIEDGFNTYVSGDANATNLVWHARSGGVYVTATRARIDAYQLGAQSGKPLAPAAVAHTFSDGASSDLGVVRSNSKLVIREVSAANGQRQFRLIRCE